MAGYMYLGNKKVCPAIVVKQGNGGIPAYSVENGSLTKPVYSLNGDEFDGVTSIGDSALYRKFFKCGDIDGILNFKDAETIAQHGMEEAFQECDGITGADFSSLEEIGYYGMYRTFYNSTGIEGVTFDSLESIGVGGLKECFYGNEITYCTFPKLRTVGDYAFSVCFPNCEIETIEFPMLTTASNGSFESMFFSLSFPYNAIQTARFTSLESVGNSCFSKTFNGSIFLKDVYFNSLKTSSFADSTSFSNMFNYMTAYISTSTTIHFPSNLETTIQGLTGYPNFGGNSGKIVLAFDLPATS